MLQTGRCPIDGLNLKVKHWKYRRGGYSIFCPRHGEIASQFAGKYYIADIIKRHYGIIKKEAKEVKKLKK